MLVSDFKLNCASLFDSGFLECLPENCPDIRCNSAMEISETLTGLKCSNPRCATKVARRLTSVASMLGAKELGTARANAFITKFQIDNPLNIFAYESDIDGEFGDGISLDMSKKIEDQFKDKRTFTLWEYVRLANLPHIQTSALQLFGEFDDLGTAYEAIESGGLPYIQKKLGIKGDEDVSIRALKIYESLMIYKSDLFESLPFVNITKINTGSIKTLKAVCSEEVGYPFVTKADFYAKVNNKYSDIRVDFLTGVTKNIDYLVWAGADGTQGIRVTNKVIKVRKYNDTYNDHKSQGTLKPDEHYIPIVTAEQFMSILDNIHSSTDSTSVGVDSNA